MNDTVCRQAAIDAVRKCSVKEVTPAFMLVDEAEVMTELMALPPAQPERKTGKWLADNSPGGGFWVCSCCKFPSEAFAANVLYKFCPNCGADMREEREK